MRVTITATTSYEVDPTDAELYPEVEGLLGAVAYAQEVEVANARDALVFALDCDEAVVSVEFDDVE